MVIERYGSDRRSVIRFMVKFDKPISYPRAAEIMDFPKLEMPPFVVDEKEITDNGQTFSTFFVSMDLKNEGTEWRTSSITAYKSGKNPSVASFSAYKPYRSAYVRTLP